MSILNTRMMNRYMKDEEDFVVEPRVKNNKKKDTDDWDWYPFEEKNTYKQQLRMAPRKKWELEEYNFQRINREMKQKAQVVARILLEEVNIPRDIIDDILTKAGFYIPRVLVFPK